ncbi:DUF6790 family protein [Brucella intermedia]|uniref:DUF6790 family protein n=1 Tax=Brucella intermedia TaxID=94625 RepID=UPI0004695147|nr:DUF6790 family protein [Brucella intermedia]
MKRGLWAGLLPYTGVILFCIALPFIWDSGATEILRQAVIFTIGWTGIGAGISHIVFGRQIASTIGFNSNSFQLEVGAAALAMGITALIVTSYSSQYWLAIILASSIYRFGCGFVHIRDMIKTRNFAVNNTAILGLNFIVPACLLAGYHCVSKGAPLLQ